jgi:hypothetical protein
MLDYAYKQFIYNYIQNDYSVLLLKVGSLSLCTGILEIAPPLSKLNYFRWVLSLDYYRYAGSLATLAIIRH